MASASLDQAKHKLKIFHWDTTNILFFDGIPRSAPLGFMTTLSQSRFRTINTPDKLSFSVPHSPMPDSLPRCDFRFRFPSLSFMSVILYLITWSKMNEGKISYHMNYIWIENFKVRFIEFNSLIEFSTVRNLDLYIHFFFFLQYYYWNKIDFSIE